MTRKWQCTIKTNGPALKLEFYVRVIGGPKVQIEIAGRKINTSLSGSRELGIYYFKDGETVQLICKKINDQFYDYGDIYLRYYDSKDTILLKSDRITDNESAFFQRTMKPEDNNNAIDCTYVTKNTNLTFPYKVVFKLINNSIDDDFTITINDLKLRPTNSSKQTKSSANENIRYYHFTYFRNQILKFSFETTNEQYGSIRFVDENNDSPKLSSFKEIKTTRRKNTVKFHTNSLKEDNYKLRVMNEGVPKPVIIAEILLSESLTPKDVMDQYRKNITTWTIDYWYSVGEPLHLSCISRRKRYLQWLFGTSVVHYTYDKIIKHNFTLSEESNETLIIICQDVNIRTIINLHRKSAYSVTTDYRDEGNLMFLILGPMKTCYSRGTSTTPLSPELKSGEGYSDNTILIVCAIVASILAVTTLGFFFYCCRYRTAKSPQTTTETLKNENQYSTPTYSTPMARTSEQNYSQGYMVQNSLYEPMFDNATAEYQHLDVKDISKEKYATARPISPQADILYVNSWPTSQQNESSDKSNRTTAEVEFNPRYANIVKGEEYSQSPNNSGAYDYSYCIRYVNSKNSGK
ncbi:unnamed protein product [Arctia plantaginis]|uniref:Uncharacterized protein n=1 Tax=Arctia plantaginis TaxID=874455 RepID=A0A8S1BCX4_ARCPL|nr:unnamed protein product [Arctia plantaginis]